MFGINKNGTKHKIGIIMPAFYPASRVTHESVSVTADGTKTWGTLLNELYALVDNTKLTFKTSFLVAAPTNNSYSVLSAYTSTSLTFSRNLVATNSRMITTTHYMTASSSAYREALFNTSGNTFSDNTSSVPASGTVLLIYY